VHERGHKSKKSILSKGHRALTDMIVGVDGIPYNRPSPGKVHMAQASEKFSEKGRTEGKVRRGRRTVASESKNRSHRQAAGELNPRRDPRF